MARTLAQEGVSLGLASRSGDDLGLDGAVASRCDVRELAQVEDAVAATVERFGRLDIVVATDFAIGHGRSPEMPELKGMMTAQDVADVVLFVLTRPRNHRVLETAFPPAGEASWG